MSGDLPVLPLYAFMFLERELFFPWTSRLNKFKALYDFQNVLIYCHHNHQPHLAV